MKLYYCQNCDKRVPSHIEEREETYPVKGTQTSVIARVRVCDACGGDCSDQELDNQTLLHAFDKYREEYGLITRDEIESMLVKYDISQRSLSSLLGWGEITIHRYIAGNIPDEAHSQMLQLIADPVNMAKIFDRNKDRLHRQAQRKVEESLNAIAGKWKDKSRKTIASPQEKFPISIYTGNVKFSEETLRNMILYFASQNGGVLKTKLMKLLWFADITHYSLHAVSISGTTYVHLPHGPAPDDYEYYLSEMNLDDEITIEETMIGEYPGYVLRANNSPDLSVLPPTAESVLKAVHEHFKKSTASEISEASHAESGYINTKNSKPISYKYAEKLKLKITV